MEYKDGLKVRGVQMSGVHGWIKSKRSRGVEEKSIRMD